MPRPLTTSTPARQRVPNAKPAWFPCLDVSASRGERLDPGDRLPDRFGRRLRAGCDHGDDDRRRRSRWNGWDRRRRRRRRQLGAGHGRRCRHRRRKRRWRQRRHRHRRRHRDRRPWWLGRQRRLRSGGRNGRGQGGRGRHARRRGWRRKRRPRRRFGRRRNRRRRRHGSGWWRDRRRCRERRDLRGPERRRRQPRDHGPAAQDGGQGARPRARDDRQHDGRHHRLPARRHVPSNHHAHLCQRRLGDERLLREVHGLPRRAADHHRWKADHRLDDVERGQRHLLGDAASRRRSGSSTSTASRRSAPAARTWGRTAPSRSTGSPAPTTRRRTFKSPLRRRRRAGTTSPRSRCTS